MRGGIRPVAVAPVKRVNHGRMFKIGELQIAEAGRFYSGSYFVKVRRICHFISLAWGQVECQSGGSQEPRAHIKPRRRL